MSLIGLDVSYLGKPPSCDVAATVLRGFIYRYFWGAIIYYQHRATKQEPCRSNISTCICYAGGYGIHSFTKHCIDPLYAGSQLHMYIELDRL